MNSFFDCITRHSGGVRITLLVSGVILSFVLSTRSQNAPAGSGAVKDPRDISGVWDKPGAAKNPAFAGGGLSFLTREEPSLTPWGMEKFKANRQGVTNPKEYANQKLDPSRYCFPPGPSRIISGPMPFEIRQLPDMVLILFERDHWVRRIYMDGRAHPVGYPITWMGHSTGKWDGDTLVVDTRYINPITWVDPYGHPQSEEMHMIERLHRVNANTLQFDTTFDDPKVYTKPWTEKKTFQLMPPGYEIVEQVECEEMLEVGKMRQSSETEYRSYQ
jgi:hypothetical protein